MLHSDHDGETRTSIGKAQSCKVEIVYTNYRGERSTRQVVPHNIWHGSTKFHVKPQWLLSAWDVERHALRTFALCDIHSWKDLGCSDKPESSMVMQVLKQNLRAPDEPR